VGENNDLEHLAQEYEELCTTTIDFKFSRGLKNSAVTFQTAVRQPTMTDLIDSPVRPAIKTRSPRLILGEIRTMKPEESTWSSVAIEKWSIPPVSTQRSTGQQIRAPALELVRVERLTNNTPPPQKGYIHAQSAGHD
jgi:hypothetical protein